MSGYLDGPAWSIQVHDFPERSEADIDSGDMREEPEVGGALCKVVWEGEVPTAEVERQFQGCPGWNTKVMAWGAFAAI